MRKEDGLLDGASGTGREIDRRTIAKGVAWTVPVVIVATAAPAAAASGSVALGPVTGTLDPSTGAVTVSGTVSSSGDGNQVTFLTVSRGTSSTSVNQSMSLSKGGSNPFSFVAPSSGGVANSYVLTYSINGGSALTQSFSVTSPTQYASSAATRTQSTVTFTLDFTGSPASKITVTSISPNAGSLSGTLPANEVLGSDLTVTFSQTRNQNGAKPSSATITLTIDGGPDLTTQAITVP